ncbi:MAG: glycosyltransferase family 4 protein [Planctomycetes bacterium]|nr:glycosyltransferase family 4 protein [Planctomycetota bacterium]
MNEKKPTLLIITQVYIPDPASVGQHLHDAAVEMVRRDYRVRVLAASRGYDDPKLRFPLSEHVDGVDVRRVSFSSFGKRSIAIRLAAQISLLFQVVIRALFVRSLDAILVSTSPPMASAAALVIAAIRRVPIVYWVMDINPDQAVALGAVKSSSLAVKLFDTLNRAILARAHAVVTLDRFMATSLERKCDVSQKLAVFPLWPHDDFLDVVAHEDNPFRAKHKLHGKFVVMYSGNHSPANPISTIVNAAERLQDHRDIVFAFIGGGAGKREVVDAIKRGAKNILDLPYQPLAEIKYSLSAADVHVVSVGASSVGVVHPSKVYGAMAVARPVLSVGPKPSHVSDLLDACDIGRHVNHGQLDKAVAAILELRDMANASRSRLGRRGQELVQNGLSKRNLCTRFGNVLEGALVRQPETSESGIPSYAWQDQPAVQAYPTAEKKAA